MKLSVENLNSYYGPAHILFDVGLDVGKGEVVALLGRNGAGKSTTSRSMVGLIVAAFGADRFEGRDVSSERRMRWSTVASAMCPKSGASSPI